MKISKCRKNVEKEIGLCRVVCLHKLLVLCYHASYKCELIPKNSLTFFDNVDRNQITICLRPILTNIKVMKCPFLDIKTWKNCQINHILCTIYLQVGLGPKKKLSSFLDSLVLSPLVSFQSHLLKFIICAYRSSIG